MKVCTTFLANVSTHRAVSILGAHLRASELGVRHLAALVEWLLVGVPAGLRVPLVVAFSPGQFCYDSQMLKLSYFSTHQPKVGPEVKVSFSNGRV